jgi:hypothetical protein
VPLFNPNPRTVVWCHPIIPLSPPRDSRRYFVFEMALLERADGRRLIVSGGSTHAEVVDADSLERVASLPAEADRHLTSLCGYSAGERLHLALTDGGGRLMVWDLGPAAVEESAHHGMLRAANKTG